MSGCEDYRDELLPKLTRCNDGMCGADDCPRCRPTCKSTESCVICGRKKYVVHICDEERCPVCEAFVCCECDMEEHMLESHTHER